MKGRKKPPGAKPGDAAVIFGTAIAELLAFVRVQETRIRNLESRVMVLSALAGLPPRLVTESVSEAVKDLTDLQAVNDKLRAGATAPTTESKQ